MFMCLRCKQFEVASLFVCCVFLAYRFSKFWHRRLKPCSGGWEGLQSKALRTPNRALLGGPCKMKPPATKGNKKRDKLGDKTEDKLGRHWETSCETKGDKRRQDLRKAGTPYNIGKQDGAQWETKGDKTIGKVDAPPKKGKQEEVQWETRGQGLGKADTLSKAEAPSNTGQHDTSKVLRLPREMTMDQRVVPTTKNPTHRVKLSHRYCACHTKRLLTCYATCWDVTKCHACHAKRGYATSETSRSDPFCRTRYRHCYTGLARTVCERLRTAAEVLRLLHKTTFDPS